jgi:cytochrome P450 family 135
VMLPTFKRWAPWLPAMQRMRRLLERTDGLISEQVAARRRQLHERGDEEAADVLAILLAARHEDGSEMTGQELRDELVTALVAGHETTASQLAWAFVHLARAPHVVERLRDELAAGEGDAYLTATVTEVQRLRPVLPNAAPRLTRAPVRIGGFEYPAGIALLASSQLIHTDPALYPEPMAFRPERFLNVTPGTYTWIPFGGGRRRCIGAAFAQQEMKIVLAEAVRRFDFEPAGRPERTARRSITFSPSAGATVILRERAPNGYQSGDGSSRGGEAIRQLPAEAPLAGDPAGGS